MIQIERQAENTAIALEEMSTTTTKGTKNETKSDAWFFFFLFLSQSVVLFFLLLPLSRDWLHRGHLSSVGRPVDPCAFFFGLPR